MPECKIQVESKTLFLWRVNVFAKVLDNQAIIADDLAIYVLMTSCIDKINRWQHVGRFHFNEKEKPNMKNDILIAYYSWSGNTRKIAGLIEHWTGGMLYEIEPVQPYTTDYGAAVSQAKKEIEAGFRWDHLDYPTITSLEATV